MDWYLKAVRNFLDFKTRAQRKEYWFYVLFYILFAIVASMIDNFFGMANPETGAGPIYMIYALVFLVPTIAVAVRRLHDTGRTGWWLLIAFLPVIGAIVLLVFYCLDSQPGDNKYGPNPKGVTA